MKDLKKYRITQPAFKRLFNKALEEGLTVRYIDLGVTSDMLSFFQSYTRETLVERIENTATMQLRRPMEVDAVSVKRVSIGGMSIMFAHIQFFYLGQVVIGAFMPPHSDTYVFALRLSKAIEIPEPPHQEANGRKVRVASFSTIQETLAQESEFELRALSRDIGFAEHTRATGKMLPERISLFLEKDMAKASQALIAIIGKDFQEIGKEFPESHISIILQADGSFILSFSIGAFEVQGKHSQEESLETDSADTITQSALIFNGWTLLEYHTKK